MEDRAFPTAPMISLQLILALFLLLLASPSHGADRQVREKPRLSHNSRAVLESDGLRYVYETMRINEAMLKHFDFSADLGMITVSVGTSAENTVYQEKYTLRPGCDKFPTISRLPTKVGAEEGWFVVLCGSDGGRHETIKAFLRGPTALDIKTSSLDFGNSFPNLEYDDQHGSYAAKVYKRMLVEDVGYGTVEYAFVYRLLIDDTVFGFAHTFGAPMERFYFDYYLGLKDEVMRGKATSSKEPGNKGDAALFGDYFGPMLSALVATEDAGRICSEMAAVESFGLTPQDLRAWRKRLVNMGYPDFSFDNCKEAAK